MEETPKKKSSFNIWYILLLVAIVLGSRGLGRQAGEQLGGQIGKKMAGDNGNRTTAVAEKSDVQTISESGLSISLPKTFEKISDGGIENYYASEYAGVTWDSEDYANLRAYGYEPNNLTLEEYLRLLEKEGDEVYKVCTDKALPFATLRNGDFIYCIFPYRGSNAFWRVIFLCLPEDFTTMMPSFLEWAQTVRVP